VDADERDALDAAADRHRPLRLGSFKVKRGYGVRVAGGWIRDPKLAAELTAAEFGGKDSGAIVAAYLLERPWAAAHLRSRRDPRRARSAKRVARFFWKLRPARTCVGARQVRPDPRPRAHRARSSRATRGSPAALGDPSRPRRSDLAGEAA
jgi:hypothetical protein